MNTATIRRNSLAAFAVLALTAVLLPGAALAAKKGNKGVKLTIATHELTTQGETRYDFDGTLRSKKNPQDRCESFRDVVVFRMLGASPDPRADEQVGSDTVDEGFWTTGARDVGAENGTYYAHAPRITGCRAGISKTITVTGRPASES